METHHCHMKIVELDHCFKLPHYKREADAAMDCYAAEDVIIDPGSVCLVPLGFKAKVPLNHGIFFLPRSGLSTKGITLSNSPGLGDPQYTGEYRAILINNGISAYRVQRGDRVCQMLVLPIPRITLEKVDELPNTERGEAGYGSSGR